MWFKEVIYYVAKYGICFDCGNEYFGEGKGTIYMDEEKFERECLVCNKTMVVYFNKKESENEI